MHAAWPLVTQKKKELKELGGSVSKDVEAHTLPILSRACSRAGEGAGGGSGLGGDHYSSSYVAAALKLPPAAPGTRSPACSYGISNSTFRSLVLNMILCCRIVDHHHHSDSRQRCNNFRNIQCLEDNKNLSLQNSGI